MNKSIFKFNFLLVYFVLIFKRMISDVTLDITRPTWTSHQLTLWYYFVFIRQYAPILRGMQSLKYTGRTLTIKNKHKFGISTRYTPSCPTIQYDVYPIVSDTTLIPHLLQYIQLRKELTLCADLKLHNCYCTCSSINSFLVYISGLICQNHQNYKAMNWKIQFFYNIY